ncbi:MAG: YeeE/YedE thiosulfate transporter family protein [Bacillota bacterium]
MNLFLALVFGLGFGYILQRVGAFEYKNILNALRLKDLTIPKFMLLSVAITSAGLFSFRSIDLAWLQLIATNPVADIAGGLIFGVGFALAGYCPGTSIGAMGEGKRDARYTVFGGILGVFVFAILQPGLVQFLSRFDMGNITLADYIPVNPVLTAALFSIILGLIIYLVDTWENRRVSIAHAGRLVESSTVITTQHGSDKNKTVA